MAGVAPTAAAAALRSTQPQTLRLLHLSDTHNLHREIEPRFGPLPPCDVLVHTGDFTDHGTDAEVADFDAWLGELKARGVAQRILVVPGNHDWRQPMEATLKAATPEESMAKAALLHRPKYYQSRMRHCEVLDHEAVDVDGLRMFGSPWDPWHDSHCPENGASTRGHAARLRVWAAKPDKDEKHRYGKIPTGVDVLLTHGPPLGFFDCVGHRAPDQTHAWEASGTRHGMAFWGSSPALRDAIEATKPAVHCFGHVHEQRGVFVSRGGAYAGGVEYRTDPAAPPFATEPPPTPAAYPCAVISSNGMANHPALEGPGATRCIAGPARLIVATRPRHGDTATPWTFSVPSVTGDGAKL